MRRMLFLILCMLSFSCGEKVIDPPQDLISKDKMTDILYDLAIINAAKSTNPKILEEHIVEPMQYLFEKYEIDSIQFVKSNIYYASLPLTYEAMYKQVESRLEKEKKKIEEDRKAEVDSARIRIEERESNRRPPIKKKAQDTLP